MTHIASVSKIKCFCQAKKAQTMDSDFKTKISANFYRKRQFQAAQAVKA
jgi:hypothetical protein